MVIYRKAENIDRETNNLRVGILQLLSLEKLYKEAAGKKETLLQ